MWWGGRVLLDIGRTRRGGRGKGLDYSVSGGGLWMLGVVYGQYISSQVCTMFDVQINTHAY